MLEKQTKRIRRHKRVRSKVKGTAQVPRLCVFRSNKHIYAQLIDDEKGKTLAQASDFEIKIKPKTKVQMATKFHDREKMKSQKKSSSVQDSANKAEKKEVIRTGKVAVAFEVGKLIAQKALAKKIKKVIFDRGGYKYHGRVKAVAEGAREGGLKF